MIQLDSESILGEFKIAPNTTIDSSGCAIFLMDSTGIWTNLGEGYNCLLVRTKIGTHLQLGRDLVGLKQVTSHVLYPFPLIGGQFYPVS